MTTMRLCAVTALVGILLAGCSDGDAADQGSTSPGTETGSPSSTTADAELEPNLPTSCDTLGSAATRAEATEGLELVEDAGGSGAGEPEGSTLELACEWFGGDVTGITVMVSTMSPADAMSAAEARGTLGYECTRDFGGSLCTMSEEVPAGLGIDATVETQDMVFTRDGVVVTMSTSNQDGQAWFSEIVADIVD